MDGGDGSSDTEDKIYGEECQRCQLAGTVFRVRSELSRFCVLCEMKLELCVSA